MFTLPILLLFLISATHVPITKTNAKRIIVYHRKNREYVAPPSSTVVARGKYVTVLDRSDDISAAPPSIVEEEETTIFLFATPTRRPTSQPPTSPPLPLRNVIGTPKNNGTGTTIYILDSGCELDLFSSSSTNVKLGPSFVENEPDVGHDPRGHGTEVLGLAASLAPAATFVCVRVFASSGSGSSSGLVLAVDWVARQCTPPTKKKCIINLSGGGTASAVMDASANDFVNIDGGVYVAAAGNYVAACSYSPGRAARVVSVSATTSSLPPRFASSFAASGSCVDVLAPGENLPVVSVNGVSVNSGTSFSSPLAAAAIALTWEAHPFLSALELLGLYLQKIVRSGFVVDVPSSTPNLFIGLPDLSMSSSSGAATTLGYIDASPWFEQWRSEWSVPKSSSLCLSASASASTSTPPQIWQMGIALGGSPPAINVRPRDFTPHLLIVSSTGGRTRVRLGTRTLADVFGVSSTQKVFFDFSSSRLIVRGVFGILPSIEITLIDVRIDLSGEGGSPQDKIYATFANGKYDPVEVLDASGCLAEWGWTTPTKVLVACTKRPSPAECSEVSVANPGLKCAWAGPAYKCMPSNWCGAPDRNACAALPAKCRWTVGRGCGK